MHLSKIWAQGLRLFQNLEINLSPGINVFIGDNGAGKTSILEAADVLSRGKSFRAAHLAEVIQHDQERIMISAEVIDSSEQTVHLGFAKEGAETQLRLNQENVNKWSDLSQHLPLLAIHPESYQLITGGPNERRKYLDWGLFHVEPRFKKVWSDYVRALKQRNCCLRMQHIQEARQWHQALYENGEEITRLRIEYFTQIEPIVHELADKLGLKNTIMFKYKEGWNRQFDLLSLLEEELKSHNMPTSTQHGPHRANVAFTWNNNKFAKSSSRGQQKVLAIALKLAQATHLFEQYQKSSIYLIDELPAELDQARCEKVLTLLCGLENQVLITSVSKEPVSVLTPQEIKWFHVEHGQVTTML